MLRQLSIISLFIIILFSCSIEASSGIEPQIINNNPEFIEEFVNPITLNWTVIDDNLFQHRIYADGNLLEDEKHEPIINGSIDITLQFSLGNGRYNFTIWVQDIDNHTTTQSISILKAEEVSDLEEVNVKWLTTPLILIMIVKLRKKIN